jgi:hypothetical protein
MSAKTVFYLIKNESGVQLSWQTIQHKVKEGNTGTLPLQQGPKGNIPNHHYSNLCMAYKSFLTINQLNGTRCVCHPKRVGPLVHKVIYGANNGSGDWQVFLSACRTTHQLT